MNNIRKNTEEEKTIVSASFKIPIIVIILSIMFILTLVALLIVLPHEISDNPYSDNTLYEMLIPICIILIITAVLLALFGMIGIKKSTCSITNKRITGVKNYFLFFKKQYSYRLDEIDNVETINLLGLSGIAINFKQGNEQNRVSYNRGIRTMNNPNTFKINFISNINEVYGALTDLLTSIKNSTDLMVDIEMSKVEAEQRKATAFEEMAKNSGVQNAQKENEKSSKSYVQELKDLKELLDAGIITQTEFENQKKKLLEK